MEGNGYRVQVENVNDLTAVKQNQKVPPQLQSCHTAIVDGYVIEGHVPVAEIERLLEERPPIAGLAVPGMPVGSPGMVVDGAADQPYDVVAFDKEGRTQIFASYGQ
jgi:hypothetical protein